MAVTSPTTSDLDTAPARCAAYGLIAHGFRYPDPVWLATFSDAAHWRGWPEDIARSWPSLANSLAAIRSAVTHHATHEATESLQQQFVTLFGHTVRGACPPYELEYGQSEVIQRASDLSDIAGFYAAFGVELGGIINERVDHVSVEAEFLAVLCGKESYGVNSGDGKLVDVARDAQRKFLKSHFARWIPAFAHRVAAADAEGFHGHVAVFADAFITDECRRFEIAQGSAYLELRPSDRTQEASQSCGLPAECGSASGQPLTQLSIDVGENG